MCPTESGGSCGEAVGERDDERQPAGAQPAEQRGHVEQHPVARAGLADDRRVGEGAHALGVDALAPVEPHGDLDRPVPARQLAIDGPGTPLHHEVRA